MMNCDVGREWDTKTTTEGRNIPALESGNLGGTGDVGEGGNPHSGVGAPITIASVPCQIRAVCESHRPLLPVWKSEPQGPADRYRIGLFR
jgi:hypothetical protein